MAYHNYVALLKAALFSRKSLFHAAVLAFSISGITACDGSSDASNQASDDKPVPTNKAPAATVVNITDLNGDVPTFNDVLEASYTYSDEEGDEQGASLFQWRRDGSSVDNANELQYTVTAEDIGKVITFAVTPRATTGTATGATVTSEGITVAPQVILSIDNTLISETSPGNTATLTARLINADDNPAAFPFDITVNLNYAGTATPGAGNDYTSADSIVIPASTDTVTYTSGSITITAVDDTKIEGAEEITVSIGIVSNALLGSQSTVSTTITDNDFPVISIPADAGIMYYVETLYGFLSTNCSNCHNTTDRPDTPFADDTDPNAAYYSALVLLGESDFENLPVLKAIDTSQPYRTSRFQSKMVGDGNGGSLNGDFGYHNCGTSCMAWADEMEVQIKAWATLVQSGGLIGDTPNDQPTNEIVLSAPPDDQPRETIVVDLSDSMAPEYVTHLGLFTSQLHTPYLSQYCSSCHSRSGGYPTPPYFADDDVDFAFRQIIETRKIDLNTPLNSRIFLSLSQDQHNCWTNCGNASTGNAGSILTGINNWSGSVSSQGFDESAYINSRALFLNDGQVASGGVRYERFVVAKYVFDEGLGTTVHDQSGVSPAIDLTLTGDFEWLSSYGVVFRNGSNARSNSIAASQKLYDWIIPRGEFTVEAWVIPSTLAQNGPAAMVSYSASETSRNFTAGQSTTNYDFAIRKDATAEGDNLSTDPYDVVLTSLQHVVMTYSTADGRRIYVNGQPELCETEVPANVQLLTCSRNVPPANSDMGDLLNWSTGQLLTLASEPNGQRQWQGVIRMVAIHNRELAVDQITQNYEAGVGQKFNLLFAIGTRDVNGTTIPGVAGVPDNSYIWFEVSLFDNYGYSFSSPYFIILDNTLTAGDLPTVLSTPVQIKSMRIGLNGREPEVGQGYTELDYTVNSTNYERDPSNTSQPSSTPPKWLLSRISTIIAQENGVNDDQFFLTFEILGSESMVRELGVAGALPFQ